MTDENKLNIPDEELGSVTKELIEKIKDEDITETAKKAFLEYAMSVIIERALPDARDGLKPVHRRILYAMNQLGITHISSYKKAARIVGDVIGKYHPHGDTAVYDSLVRMAQPFSMRLPMIDGQGNFGSIDGDSPAAMRYTEARMGIFPSKYMFKDLLKDTVSFIPNYDGSETIPTVLTLKYPNLIINGVDGIAVGMASNIPPHNPIESMECVKYKVMNRISGKEDSIQELMDIMPSPDFPTGGHIHGLEDYSSAWTNGSAKFYLRSKWDEKELSNGRVLVTITEIPYQKKKFDLVEKLEDLIKPNELGVAKLEGVQSVEDGSDRSGLRIEIVIKNEYDVNSVMEDVLKQTGLQDSYKYNSTVLVEENGKLTPKVIGLNKLFDIFIDHRIDIITKRSIYDVEKISARIHILNALQKAIDPKNIDKVIETIRKNKDAITAKESLMDLLDVDDLQAQEILQIRLSRLVGLEIEKIENEIKEKKEEVDKLNNIIENNVEKLKIIIEESEEMISEFVRVKSPDLNFYKNLKYPFKERISTYQIEKIKDDKAALTKEEDCNIIVTKKGFLRRLPISDLCSMNRGARGKKQIKLSGDDFIQKSISSHSHSSLLFVTDKGQAYVKPAYEISDAEKGRHINRILELSDRENEKVVDIVPVDFEDSSLLVAMFTKNGLIKMTKLADYMGATRKGGIKAIKLRDNDSILCISICKEEDTLFMVNSNNLIIRFPVSDISVVGRASSGVIGMKLDKGVKVVGAGQIFDENGFVVCVSENGLIKITCANQYKIQSRSGKGVKVMKVNERSGTLFNAFYVGNLKDNVVATTVKGYSNSIPLKNFNITNRTTTGVKLLSLDKDDSIVDVFRTPFQEELKDLEEGSEMVNDIETV